MEEKKIYNIVYQLPAELKSKIVDLETESISTQNSYLDEEKHQRALEILNKYELDLCRKKILTHVSDKDSVGFIYAYYTASRPGIFKVGRSKNLPTRRISNQARHNNEKYFNKESFECKFHQLAEACIHLELKSQRLKLEKKQDGYTEWFRIEWEPLRKKITSVISAIKELLLNGLLNSYIA
jgi:T5orf172 domain